MGRKFLKKIYSIKRTIGDEMLIDTHAHLDDDKFTADQAEVIARARESGITKIINIGYNRETILTTIELTKQYDFIFGAIGWHPNNANEMQEKDLLLIEEESNNQKILAIGEIGLDYYWDYAEKKIQQKIFREQIRLAKKLQLPIIIHDRDAHQDVLTILKEEEAGEVGGIMHSFSGSLEMARECLDLGFYLSFSGPVTFKNAKRPQEVASNIPLDRILVETDCPYLTPEPFRGKRNEPLNVKYIVEKIAELRGLPVEEMERITTENAKRIFKL